MIVHKFTVASELACELDKKNPNNIFRDDACKNCISDFVFQCQQNSLKTKLAKEAPCKVNLVDDVSVKTSAPNIDFRLDNTKNNFTSFQALERTKCDIIPYS